VTTPPSLDPDTFHDLLDEATSAAPPSRFGADLSAGRTMLRRRRAVETVAGLAAVALVAVTIGAALTGTDPATEGSTGFATDPPAAPTATAARPDPTVLSDVVDAAFPLPGPAQRRNIRVQTFLRGWGIERCGGTAAPIDSTADRFEQDVLPDLELIRERGFTEPVQESTRGVDEDCQIGDLLQAAAPAWGEWRELVGPWLDLVDETLGDEGLVALRAPMAECLRQATGLAIDDADPVGSLFDAADDRDATDQEQRQTAAAFADCGADYFGRLEGLLRDERPAYVEQHRDLLEDFAHQIAAMGYAP